MKIDTLKELEKLVQMCNKHGVSDIEVDGIKLKLNGAPDAKNGTTSNDKIETPDQYTDEQILMWSAAQADIG